VLVAATIIHGVQPGPLLAVIHLSRSIIMRVILVLCTVGALALANRLFDICLMAFIGVCGFVLRKAWGALPLPWRRS
jgi:TctA family transporter